MSTRTRCVTRQRKNQLHLDLNSVPSVYIEDQTGTSSQVPPQNNQATILPQNNQATLPSQNNQATMQGQPVPPNMIDVEAIEDDVIIMSSPRAFAQAKTNSRRSQRRPIIDLDSERTKVTPNKRRKVASKQPINNCDDVIILEKSTKQHTVQPPPPPPPKKPIFSCPICMCPFVEEISTKCGHIFCKRCINAALKVKPLCPTCRRTVAKKDLMRVFLPTTTACC